MPNGLFLCAWLTLITSCASTAWSQGEKGDALEQLRIAIPRQTLTFDQAIKLISDQAKINIIADDLPLRKFAEYEATGTAKQALDEIGRQFDYAWSRNRFGAIILVKRFEDPAEYPQVHREDVADIAKREITAIRKVGERPDRSKMADDLHALYSTFDQSQLAMLRNGASPMVRDLAPPQQALVIKAMIEVTFGMALNRWEIIQSELANFDKAQIKPAGPIRRTSNGVVTEESRGIYYCWKDSGHDQGTRLPFDRGIGLLWYQR